MSALAVITRAPDDRDLVAGVRAGDDHAFELLFQRYQPRIAAYVRGKVRDHGRAEDITQEVFMAALRRMREETEREILFKPWIYEIAKNKCIDAFRRSCNASEISLDVRDAVGADEHGRLAEPGATPDSAVEGKLAIDNLCGAFGGLSPVHHDVLVLRELEGLSYREIGERLGLSLGAVESTLFRARKRLSEEYEEIASGERCLRVQRIVDASTGRSGGLRDQRRMARHLAHCQPCRRYAGRLGLDLGTLSRPAAAAARIAAFLPLPTFLRRRWDDDEATPLIGHGGTLGQWSANVAPMIDPGLMASWTKALATAATVAVAGMGAGAAFDGGAPRGAVLAPGAPFAQAPGLGLLAPGGGGADAAPAQGRRTGVDAPSARQERPGQPDGARSRSAGGAPAGTPATPGAATAPAQAGERRSRASEPATSDRRTLGAVAPPAADGEPAAPDPGEAVGQVVDKVGATRAGDAGGSNDTAAASSSAEGASSKVGQAVPVPATAPPDPAGADVPGTLAPSPGAAPAPAGSVSTPPAATAAPYDIGG